MTIADAFLERLDRERSSMGTRSPTGARTAFSRDGKCCAIVDARGTDDTIDTLIREEIARADAEGYVIDWKVHGHDRPSDLRARLLVAGFEAEPAEQLLALRLNEEAVGQFSSQPVVIERVAGRAGLDDVAEISREIGRKHVEQERDGFAERMAAHPERMSIFVARVRHSPAACGRIHYCDVGGYAELCGGRTKTTFRNRGLYLAIVRARLAEALERGYAYASVDALPTSEPLLRKRGFEWVTWTQPLIYRPPRRG